MSEPWSGLYCPGQKLTDTWVLRAAIGTSSPIARFGSTTRVELKSGAEERWKEWPPGTPALHRFPMTVYIPNQIAEGEWFNFFEGRQGGGNNFAFFDLEERRLTKIYVGTSDGSVNHVATARGLRDITAVHTVTPAGVETARTFTSIVDGFGAGGESRITGISGPPANGDTVKVTGYVVKRWIVVMDGDEWQKSYLMGGATRYPRPMWPVVFRQVRADAIAA